MLKKQNFSRKKRRKKVDFASFLPTKQGQKKLCHTSSDKKATNFGLKLFNDASKSPNKFKEIISLILPQDELIM